jgi:hypothetical protein
MNCERAMIRIIYILAVLVVAGLCRASGTAHALTTAQTVVIAGQALAGSDTLGNAKIIITLVGSPCYTTTDLMPSASITTYANAAGVWSKSIVGSDSISCVSGATPTYTIEVQHSVLTKSGMHLVYGGLAIPATNGATTQLRTIIAAQ